MQVQHKYGLAEVQGSTTTKREDDELTMCLQQAARMCGYECRTTDRSSVPRLASV